MKIPQRIQRKRTKGWKMPPNTVYVGRPTKWGNPYKMGELTDSKYPVTNMQAVGFYKQMIEQFRRDGILADLSELKGKNLACWCPILDKKGCHTPCHADILLKLANQE